MASNADAETYFAAIDEAKKAYPFGKELEPGYCPLCIAEHMQQQTLVVMINEAAYITGIAYDDIEMLEHYRQLEALVVKLVLNHPGIDPATFAADQLLRGTPTA